MDEFNMNIDLEFKAADEGFLISPVCQPRGGCEESFKSASKSKKKEILLGKTIGNKFDREEWDW